MGMSNMGKKTLAGEWTDVGCMLLHLSINMSTCTPGRSFSLFGRPAMLLLLATWNSKHNNESGVSLESG